MVKTVTMKNAEIYTTASQLLEGFQEDIKLPIKVNFYLQKNIQEMVNKGQEIDKARNDIFDKYGTRNEEGQYTFEPEIVDEANKELADLFDLEQDVKVYTIPLDDFGNIELTSSQTNAIKYMIEDFEDDMLEFDAEDMSSFISVEE